MLPTLASGQFVLPANTMMGIEEGTQFTANVNKLEIQNGSDLKINDDASATLDTKLLFIVSGDIINANTAMDFSNTKLQLELNGATQSIAGNFFVDELLLNGEGAKTMNGAITVTNKILFVKGVLTPTATAKMLFTGPADGVTASENNAYYNGIFYSLGSGRRTFPVGVGGLYTPAVFESTTGEIGIRVISGSAALTIDNVEIIELNEDRYWEITTDPLQVNSRVSLSLNGLEVFDNTGGGTTILQSDKTGGIALNLGSATSDDTFIASQKNVTSSILTFGKEVNIDLKIHDLITPFGSAGYNDKLYIDNIDRFDSNTVTLLDRWGSSVAKWVNYTNDISYDFSRLSPGNYICIVEYGKADQPKKVAQQMVTVLKVN